MENVLLTSGEGLGMLASLAPERWRARGFTRLSRLKKKIVLDDRTCALSLLDWRET